jgi:glycosyltransferase 2 family protein
VETQPEDIPVPQAKRSWLKLLIRVLIGLLVIGILVWRTPNRADLQHALARAHIGYALAAGLALFANVFVSALRWEAYLGALEIDMPFKTTVRLYFVGTFFNAFLPSGIGGDAYKAIRVGRARGAMTGAFASVFLDRFAGFVALGLIGLVGAAAELAAGEKLRVAAVATVLSVGMLGAAAVLLLGGERLLGRGRLIKEHGIGGKLRGAVRAIHAAARHPDAAARGYLMGLLFQALVLGYHLAIARALGLKGISVGGMAGVVVIASLATVIPLSPGGLGFREAAYVWALGAFGIPRSEALAFALLVLAILLATSLVGGIVYVIAGGDVPSRR